MKVIRAGSKAPRKKKVEDRVDDKDLPTKIDVEAKGAILNVVPGHVFRTRAFKWQPMTFATEAEQLNSRFIETVKQDKSLITFLKAPDTPMIYGVSGNPDDSKAKYFAAYLIAAHMKFMGAEANPIWATLFGGFDNPHLNSDRARPTLLVLANLTPNSTALKLEKARDLIEAYPDIPRIVVCAGLDPLSFLATRLYVPVQGIAYFSEALVKKAVDII